MIEKTKKFPFSIEENMKVILMMDNQVFISRKESHQLGFQELIEEYFGDNSFLTHCLEEERLYSIQDYFVKENDVVILNLSTNYPFRNHQLLISFQDICTDFNEQDLLLSLPNSDFDTFTICMHNANNQFGPYHYHQIQLTKDQVPKEKSLRRLFV